MTTTELELRLAHIERELKDVKRQLAAKPAVLVPARNWINQVWGMYDHDPAFKEAIKIGRKWRRSENGKTIRRKKSK